MNQNNEVGADKVENEYRTIHQFICSECGSRDFESSYSSDMSMNYITVICKRCRITTEIGQVPVDKDKNFKLVKTPTLQKNNVLKDFDSETNERFNKLIEKDGTRSNDVERIALFYIFSRNYELYTKVNSLYDFNTHWIKDDCFEKVDFSSGAKKMGQLAFNLYNNSPTPSLLEMFANLDSKNYNLAMKAINIRFNKI